MTPTKLLIGQILVVFAIVILGVWAATQWAADMLGYQAQLGAPWFILFGWPVYEPWKLFVWWYHYEAYAPEVFDKAGMFAGASGFMGCAAAIVGSLWRARQSRLVTTYGSSRWTARSREHGRAFSRVWSVARSTSPSSPESRPRTRGQAKADVFDYIERFYNPRRRHSTLGYLSPMEFEKKMLLA